ncbi:dihydrofolate reductase family protein [Brucepastera parasyntrophica]|uniref:dihydrofolate reductase family protein n=1 Tax=Brucepastera parasyntrophica TaxID=2880008 RepID=UPI00210ED2DE|nr:dihydrofolate reductase family protein [Brucepastera parasyntrophica]ULQ58572.1 dihydrofolate reductase family protein [Brucepastera parasyntrophica]
MANIIYIACSIDGFIAREDGDIDWLVNIPNKSNSDYGFEEFMNRIDGIIMGRKTFEKVLEINFWPYTKPVFVLSGTLKKLPEELEKKAEIVSGSPEDIIKRLNAKGIKNIYIDGGTTIRNFLKEGLIDEMIITTASIILGAGIPLFAGIGTEKKFAIEKTEQLNEYLVKIYYKKKDENADTLES